MSFLIKIHEKNRQLEPGRLMKINIVVPHFDQKKAFGVYLFSRAGSAFDSEMRFCFRSLKLHLKVRGFLAGESSSVTTWPGIAISYFGPLGLRENLEKSISSQDPFLKGWQEPKHCFWVSFIVSKCDILFFFFVPPHFLFLDLTIIYMHWKIGQGNKKLSGANIRINLEIVSGNISAVNQKRKMNGEFCVGLKLPFIM